MCTGTKTYTTTADHNPMECIVYELPVPLFLPAEGLVPSSSEGRHRYEVYGPFDGQQPAHIYVKQPGQTLLEY